MGNVMVCKGRTWTTLTEPQLVEVPSTWDQRAALDSPKVSDFRHSDTFDPKFYLAIVPLAAPSKQLVYLIDSKMQLIEPLC